MSIAHLFTPISPTVNLSVTTSSARVAKTALPGGSAAPHEVRLVNVSSVVIFVEFGDSTVVASASTSYPLLPNTVEAFQMSAAQTHIAAIAASGTATLYATSGLGV